MGDSRTQICRELSVVGVFVKAVVVVAEQVGVAAQHEGAGVHLLHADEWDRAVIGGEDERRGRAVVRVQGVLAVRAVRTRVVDGRGVAGWA